MRGILTYRRKIATNLGRVLNVTGGSIKEEGFLPLVEMTERATVSFRRSKATENLFGRVFAEEDIVNACNATSEW